MGSRAAVVSFPMTGGIRRQGRILFVKHKFVGVRSVWFISSLGQLAAQLGRFNALVHFSKRKV